MSKYRIVKVNGHDDRCYVIEQKLLFVWIEVTIKMTYTSAKSNFDRLMTGNKRVVVETGFV